MISVQTMDGDLIKVLHNINEAKFGFHKLFGFIGFESASNRIESRKRQAYDFTENKWDCSFKIKTDKNKWQIGDLVNCEATSNKDGSWTLKTASGSFNFVNSVAATPVILEDIGEAKAFFNKWAELFLIGAILIMPILYMMLAEPSPEKVEEKKPKTITVKIVKKADVVKIAPANSPKIKVKPLTKSQISKRAVARNLGFLGMVGSKDMKKVVGGVPQKLKAATAGAGKGGDAGSGGELIAGLGKGLRKTTVGNTGVAGLGGVGTKGAGGGKGGYGNTRVASGSGKGISAIAVSSSNLTLEGGLSRYAINATIAKYMSQVRRCYEAQLNVNPGIQGLVELNFMINGSGRLDFAKISRTTLKNPATEKCITNKMMSWQFPKPKGGVKVPVKYPFMLRPVGR